MRRSLHRLLGALFITAGCGVASHRPDSESDGNEVGDQREAAEADTSSDRGSPAGFAPVATRSNPALWGQLQELVQEQRRLEKAVQDGEAREIPASLASAWLLAQAGEGAAERIEQLTNSLLSSAPLLQSAHRIGSVPWSGDWWISTYQHERGTLALAWLVSDGGLRLGEVYLRQARDSCCGEVVPEGVARCTACQVDPQLCICPLHDEGRALAFAIEEEWTSRCCVARDTEGRALCRGCARLLRRAGLGAAITHHRQRLQLRGREGHQQLAALGQVSQALGSYSKRLAAAQELERGRERLRQTLVAFAQDVEQLERILLSPCEESVERALAAAPEDRLAEREERLATLSRECDQLLLVLRNDLEERVHTGELALASAFEVTDSLADRPRDLGPLAALRRAARRALERGRTRDLRALKGVRAPSRGELEEVLLRSLKAWELARHAEEVLLRDEVSVAVEALMQARSLLPYEEKFGQRLVEALMLRSVGRAGVGDYAAALEDAGRSIELDATHAWAFSQRGYCRRRLGDLEGAAEDLLRACELGSTEAKGDLVALAELVTKRAWERNASGKSEAAAQDWQLAWRLESQARGSVAPGRSNPSGH